MSFENLEERQKAEWASVYGYPMPPHIKRLMSSEIQDAIEFGRKKLHPVTETVSDDSIQAWDGHKEF